MATGRKRKKATKSTKKRSRRRNVGGDSGLGSGDVLSAMDEMIPQHAKDYMKQKHM